jgi:acyl-CoA thioesterase 8
VPSNFTVHSMHCYFVLAGDSEIPVMYYVEHVREGRSFATRTVQARQRGKCIFTTTMSFVREDSGGATTISHAIPLPDGLPPPPHDDDIDEIGKATFGRPFVSQQVEILNTESDNPHEKKTRQWIKAAGRISPDAGHQTHISALAYMSDSYFIGTISRIHGLARYLIPESKKGAKGSSEKKKPRARIGMMVSLDHTIYFHQPRKFRADEWMFAEMSSPWSGDGRGVVTQHMFARDGTLVATCFQEVSLLLA